MFCSILGDGEEGMVLFGGGVEGMVLFTAELASDQRADFIAAPNLVITVRDV